jgi:hypothetical protein
MMPKVTKNLLALKPVRSVDWEARDNGCVALCVPKFRHPLLRKWVLPRLRTPILKVNLDDVGSFVWGLCDGETTVGTIAGRLQREFGDRLDPDNDRLALFFRMLEREHYVSMG